MKKIIYRNLERNTLKLEKKKALLMFNETCYNNDILPTYTNTHTCVERECKKIIKLNNIKKNLKKYFQTLQILSLNI